MRVASENLFLLTQFVFWGLDRSRDTVVNREGISRRAKRIYRWFKLQGLSQEGEVLLDEDRPWFGA